MRSNALRILRWLALSTAQTELQVNSSLKSKCACQVCRTHRYHLCLFFSSNIFHSNLFIQLLYAQGIYISSIYKLNYENSLLPWARRTRERVRKSASAWKRDTRVPSSNLQYFSQVRFFFFFFYTETRLLKRNTKNLDIIIWTISTIYCIHSVGYFFELACHWLDVLELLDKCALASMFQLCVAWCSSEVHVTCILFVFISCSNIVWTNSSKQLVHNNGENTRESVLFFKQKCTNYYGLPDKIAYLFFPLSHACMATFSV